MVSPLRNSRKVARNEHDIVEMLILIDDKRAEIRVDGEHALHRRVFGGEIGVGGGARKNAYLVSIAAPSAVALVIAIP